MCGARKKADLLYEVHQDIQDCHEQVRTRGGGGLRERFRKLLRRKESSTRRGRGPPTETLRIMRSTRRDEPRHSGSRTREEPVWEPVNDYYYTDDAYRQDRDDMILQQALEASRRQVSTSSGPQRLQERHRSRSRSSSRRPASLDARNEAIDDPVWIPDEELPPPYVEDDEDHTWDDFMAQRPSPSMSWDERQIDRRVFGRKPSPKR